MFAFEFNGTFFFLERKSSESIYPLAAGLDCNFGQDVWIRHFHGYGIGALCPPVSVKLENVFWFVGFHCCAWVEGTAGSGWWEAQSHEDFRVGVVLGGVGDRDKQGSDDDDDGGTRTVPDVLLCFRGPVKGATLDLRRFII